MSIHNFISIVNQGVSRNSTSSTVLYTILNEELCKLLVSHGFLISYQCLEGSNKIRLIFKYSENANILYELIQISKWSRRLYITSKFIGTKYRNNWFIISSPKGLHMSSSLESINHGGEVLMKILF